MKIISDRQRLLLIGILADANLASTLPCPVDEPSDGFDLRLIREWEQEQAGICRSDPARWLNKDLTPSDYVMLTRDWKALEAAGLIERYALGFGGIAKTHLQLTPAGIALAKALAAETVADG